MAVIIPLFTLFPIPKTLLFEDSVSQILIFINKLGLSFLKWVCYNHIRIAMPMEGFLPLASAKTENLTDYPAMLFWRLPYGE